MEIVELVILSYFILSAIIANLWLGWHIPFCIMGFAIVPMAALMFIINKVFRKKVVIDGVEISFD